MSSESPLASIAKDLRQRASTRARSRWLRTISVVVLCGFLGGAQQQPADPNFLFLVIDALRADHVGYLGYEHDTTPTIDALALRGITFTDTTSPSTYTRASVPSIFTSVFPSVHGVLSQGKQVETLSDGFTTLAEQLSARGYATAAFMPNPSLKKAFNFGQGFDLYDDKIRTMGPHVTRHEKSETASKIHRRALEWLDSGRADRFFMYLHYRDVHGPYLPPPRYADMFWNKEGKHRKLSKKEKKSLGYLRRRHDHDALEYYLSQYDAEIRYTDDKISEFLSQLEARGLLENTVIVVTADHGESFLEHGKWNHGNLPYQEEIHVPLLLVLPESKHAGSRIAQPVQTHDLYPTVLDILKLPKPPELQGVSLFEAIQGTANPARPLFSEGKLRGGKPMASVRVGHWKLIYAPDKKTVELYNLRSDPMEKHNLAKSEPRRLTGLVKRLEDFRKQSAQRVPPATEKPAELDAETVESLRSLGYIE